MSRLCLLPILFLMACSGLRLSQQEMTAQQKEIDIFQENLNQKFANEETSPLRYDSIPSFKSLDFFPASSDYIVKAKLIRTPDSKPFQVPTSAGKLKTFKKYADLHFRIKGKKLQLEVYKNLQMSRHPLFGKLLFLPFTDASNGEFTYGGGRYLDLEVPDGDQIVLNFNKAYNPYCAYSDRYNCPIPPKENALPVAILAGVKAYNK
ncbi:MAG: DUF1684 domain-containing protein [Bacteroidota bacterium]